MSKFIVIEGIECSGGTTQVRMIAKWLRGEDKRVVVTREPGGTKTAEMLRKVALASALKSEIDPITETFIFCASRANHITKIIKPALERDQIVICDRFSPSTFVYQCGVDKVPLDIVSSLNRIATQGVEPDLVIVLDVDIEEAKKRLKRAKNRHLTRQDRKSLQYFKKLRVQYLRFAKFLNWEVVDGSSNKKEVHKKIQEKINKIL